MGRGNVSLLHKQFSKADPDLYILIVVSHVLPVSMIWQGYFQILDFSSSDFFFFCLSGGTCEGALS